LQIINYKIRIVNSDKAKLFSQGVEFLQRLMLLNVKKRWPFLILYCIVSSFNSKTWLTKRSYLQDIEQN